VSPDSWVKAQSVASLAREPILGREESFRRMPRSEIPVNWREEPVSRYPHCCRRRNVDYHDCSMKRMNLKEGDKVFAIIKATEVSVEKE
jgi:hypothetical protein